MKKILNLLWRVLVGSFLIIAISVILFPIIGLIALFNKPLISKLILPAQILKFTQIISPNKQLHHFKVNTKDNAQLDTVEIYQSNEIPGQPKHYLIYFCGNAMSCTESLEILKELSDVCKVTVIGFDYKGVNKSTGKTLSFSDLIDTGQAQVQRLLNQGVQSQHICLYGFSLGGAVAIAVAERFYKQNQPVYCFNDRSFSSIAYVVKSRVQDIPFAGRVVALLWFPLIQRVLDLLGWGYNVAHAYHKIPNDYKAYIFVKEDEAIPYEASLDQGLSHFSPVSLSPSSEMKVASKYKHVAPIDTLINKDCVSGLDFFKNFINRMPHSHLEISEKRGLQAEFEVKTEEKRAFSLA